MGGVIVFQWPIALYASGLMGLQRQVLLNTIRSGISVIQTGGAVLVLWLISPSIQAFFIWQLLAYMLQARFETKWLLHNWRFSAGTMGIALLATILTQLDKIIISKWFSLTIFGYYTLAYVVSNALSSFASPIFSAVFPRFSQLFAEWDENKLAVLYHKSSQLMSLLIVPIGINLALFSDQVLSLWIGDAEVVSNVSPLLSVIILGTVANSVMMLPLALQLASGWTKLSFYKNLFAIVLFIPMLFILISNFGLLGAPIAWVALNFAYIVFEVPIMHRKLLRNEMHHWYLVDIFLPVFITIFIGFFMKNWWLFNLAPVYSFFSSVALTWLLLIFVLPVSRELLFRNSILDVRKNSKSP